MKIYLDGKFVDEADAKVSVFDHGLLYGDGVFEGIRLYDGNVFRLEEHLERLEYSAKAILLTLPLTAGRDDAGVCETCRQNGLRDAYIRLVVTRGVGRPRAFALALPEADGLHHREQDRALSAGAL